MPLGRGWGTRRGTQAASLEGCLGRRNHGRGCRTPHHRILAGRTQKGRPKPAYRCNHRCEGWHLWKAEAFTARSLAALLCLGGAEARRVQAILVCPLPSLLESLDDTLCGARILLVSFRTGCWMAKCLILHVGCCQRQDLDLHCRYQTR